MKAVHIKDFGDVENLEIVEIDEPNSPAAGEVRVRVMAAGLNRADILQRMGRYPAPSGYPERIPGLEFAGIIDSLGPGVSGVAVNDRVMGIIPGGAQTEKLNINADLLSPIPEAMTFEEAAAIPEAFVTAYDSLMIQAGLKKDEAVLIHAVASGVGLAAVQIARSIGARVYGTSRNGEKLIRASGFGLTAKFETNGEKSFAEWIKETTGGVDVILDLVGAKYLAENIASLNQRGRLMLVGLTSGAKTEIDLSVVLSKRLTLKGTVLRSRSLEERKIIAAMFNENIIPLFESGELKPNVDSVFPVSEIREAHRRIEANQNFGKVIITF